MKRFIRLLTTVIVLMALCSCGAVQKNSTDTSVETTAPPAEVEVLVESETNSKSELLTARPTLSEALKEKANMYLDSTGWGYDQKKANITITGNNQNIVSVQQQQAMYLAKGGATGYYSSTAESIEYVKEPGRLLKIEPWIDATRTPTIILQITLEDNSMWFVAIHAKGY